MYPTDQSVIAAYAKGPKGDPGSVAPSDLTAAIAALLGSADSAGNTLGKLEALIAVCATLNQISAFTVSPTVPTLSPGNNSTKAANSAYLRQELINYALPLAGGTMAGALTLNADPVAALQAATKQYVDAFIQGISNKYSATCATAAALPSNTYSNGTSGVGATLTATANGGLTVDTSVTPAVTTPPTYVLVKNEAAPANNGLYQVTQAGDSTHPYILTRAVDDDVAAEMAGAFCFVELGTVNNKTGWLCGQSAITIGTTAIAFTQFSGAGTYGAGTGLSLTGSIFALLAASAGAIGGVNSISGVAHNWIASIDTAGLPHLSQPAFTDISGSVAASQMPAFTGDVTTVAGAVAATLATVNANVGSFGSATQVVALTVNGKGLVTAAANTTITPPIGSVTGLGTGVATALGVNSGSAGSVVINGGALGTPASGNVANCVLGPVTSAVVHGTYNLATASGTQVVSGFGFTPSSCDGLGAVSGATLGTYATLSSHCDSALSQAAIGYFANAVYFDPAGGDFFIAGDASGSNYQIGVITAYGSGSITITWTKAGSPTGTFSFSIRAFK
jgi:hypothetical protein